MPVRDGMNGWTLCAVQTGGARTVASESSILNCTITSRKFDTQLYLAVSTEVMEFGAKDRLGAAHIFWKVGWRSWSITCIVFRLVAGEGELWSLQIGPLKRLPP